MPVYPYRQFEEPSPPPQEKPPPRVAQWRARIKRLYERAHNVLLVLLGVIIAFAMMLAYSATQPPPQRLTQRDIDAAVARVLASATPPPSIASQVYAIIAPSLVRVEGNIPGSATRTTVGTGTVIDDRGHILSSLHIVERSTKIQVTFFDGTETEARIVARDAERDLVLLRPFLLPDNLVPATLGSSAMLQVGDEAIVVGNPFGISNSLSAGVISGLRRNFRSPRTGATLTNLIQFDAAVNPGNSGGPLLNRNGEVVGVVTGLLNPTDQEVFIGIGFAVPIETAAAALGSPEH
ncbi:MAG: trypsin-like peptidase domain-containing protein [Anaerolineae bacterium]|nr:trypsin-like peptidase domain-containing protein [Anaerolineae bacterium]